MGGYFHNLEDARSSPDLIAVNYRIGRSIAFEVDATLGEFNEQGVPNSGGLQGSPALIAVEGAENPQGCPGIESYVPIGTSEEDLRCIKVKSLAGRVGEVRLYNPITRNFNLLVDFEIVERPMYGIATLKGWTLDASQTHKIIRNTQDCQGQRLTDHVVGTEILSADKTNIYSDCLVEMKDIGTGKVAIISLETEFLYAVGAVKWQLFVSRNRKNLGEL